MKKLRGFTLIELLIVVAIIAILAAIAIPNFLEAQVRSKVSRVRSDHRSLATALEAYYVDNNQYPLALGGTSTSAVANWADVGFYSTAPSANISRTFRLRGSSNLSTLTTPIAYITTYFPDPFADVRGTGFRYYADNAGWVLGSWGPDTDQSVGGDMGWDLGTNTTSDTPGNGIETIYTSLTSQPSVLLLAGANVTTNASRRAFTYDPTNGTITDGDVWRVKQ